jgi:hypothetical protein
MKRLTLTCYFWLIVMLLVTISARQTSAQQQRFKEARKSVSVKTSGKTQRAQEVKYKEETVRAGRLTSGETMNATPAEASTLKMVRRNPSVKVTKEERPAGRRPASPRLEFAGGHERAREPVSPREDFRAKQ